MKQTPAQAVFAGTADYEDDEFATHDFCVLKQFCEKWYERLGVKNPNISPGRIYSAVANMPVILNRCSTTATPSVFKKAAAWTMAFVEASPLLTNLYETPLAKFEKNQNALVIFEFCRIGLHGAKVFKCESGKKRETVEFLLERKIVVSSHQYQDIIHALAENRTEAAFHLIALLYETLCCSCNPGLAYKDRV